MSTADTASLQTQYRLWVAERDGDGRPIHPMFAKAAYALEPSLFGYRRRELGCLSLAATLMQQSVDKASAAHHSQPVANPVGYLWTAFTRRVDRYLKRSGRESAMKDDFIEDLQSRRESIYRVEWLLEDRILMMQLMEHLDDWTRSVLHMRIAGYSFKEIGADISMDEDSVSTRYRRAIARAVERLKPAKR